jgi:heterodisulfide reductase subunit D
MTENHKSDLENRETLETDSLRDIPLNSLKMKQLIELDACTRCGECLTWCPVYDQDTKEAIIPRRKVIDFLNIAKAQQGILAKILRSEKISNPLKAMLGRIFRYREIGKTEIDDFVQNLYECSTCGQCEVVCPAHIETVMLWEELRRVIVQAGYGPLEAQKALVKSVKAFDNPWQQPRAARVKWARRAKKDGLIQKLPREIKKTKAKVLLFFGCTASYDVNVKQVAINTINILEALNIDYGILGSEEKCCASVLLRMGDPEHERVFKENIDLFNSLGIETLISSCSGCFKTIMQDYPRVAPLNFEVLHTIEYLARLLKQGHLVFPHPVNRTVTFHDPCHLGRATGGFDAPRLIMEAIPSLNLVEMPRNKEYSRCCGAGGGLKAGFPDIQNKMAQRRVKEAEETGADSLVSCCPFCFQGLNIGITAVESQLMMKDMSSLVAESLLGYDVFEKASKDAAIKAKKKERKTKISSGKVSSVPGAVTTMNSDDKQASRKDERERKRAERRAARRKKTVQKPDALPADPQLAGITENAQALEDPPVEAVDPEDAKKTEKKRKRAERRAAREKEKELRRASRR